MPKEKMIHVYDVLRRKPQFVQYPGKYMIIYDQTLLGFKFDNVSRAINVSDRYGWKSIQISTAFNPKGIGGEYMYSLLERVEELVPPDDKPEEPQETGEPTEKGKTCPSCGYENPYYAMNMCEKCGKPFETPV